jgi:hypothetical protein
LQIQQGIGNKINIQIIIIINETIDKIVHNADITISAIPPTAVPTIAIITDITKIIV